MKRILSIGIFSILTLICHANNSYNDKLLDGAYYGDLNVVIEALKNGAEINARGSGGSTALTLAAAHGHFEIIDCLIKKGADVNVVQSNGVTALHYSAYGYPKITKLLLDAGAKESLKIKDVTGHIPLDYAIRFKDKENIELLDIDDSDSDSIDFDNIRVIRKKLDKLNLPQAVYKKVKDKIDLYEKMPQNGHESGDIKKFLQSVFGLPWNQKTEDNLDIKKATAILDEDHFGLKKIKDRILDFIAVRQLKSNGYTPIICFVGPPGIGKTSLVKSIARSLGRQFHRISLGGLRDVAELKGHNSTYIGSLPGQIMQALTAVKSSNPVILLDEIDKMSDGNHYGDPSATMLEILDPNQNNTFHDNYFGFTYDLSNVMFVATANSVESIPGPLRDRMEIIYLNGYTIAEKVAIAKNYLVKKAKFETGLEKEKLNFSDELLQYLAQNYSFEAGVRELERVIKKLCAKAARALVEEKKLIDINISNVENYLGKTMQQANDEYHTNQIGVTNGLAWTSIGGEVLRIESLLMPGTGKLMLTGSLGKVMKESIKAALSYIRAHAKKFNIDPSVFNSQDLHIHLPSGAMPKDGPSAGIALITSLVSSLTSKIVDSSYAMTGEINLRGNVTAIGGLKEKILAAKRNKIKHVIAPKQNMHDLDDSPEVLQDIDIIWVDKVDEVLDRVLIK